MGHFNRRFTDAATGESIRQQPCFVIGKVADLTEAEAKRKCREYVEQAMGMQDQKTTLGWFITHRWIPLHEGIWRPSTKATNEQLLKIITDRWGSTALPDLDLVELQKWLNAIAKKRSGSAIKHLVLFMRSICREAHEQDFVRKDPARLLRLPRIRQVKRTYLTEAEITAVLKACKWQTRDGALLRLVIMTGLRPSELFALRWKCFSDGFTTLTIHETVYRGQIRPYSKTTEENATEFVTQYVPQTVALSMAEWYAKTKHNGDEDFVFPNSEGGWITKENYTRRTLYPLADQAGVKRFNFQSLRRSVATHMQGKGSPKDIATVLRHRKADTAQQSYVLAVESSVREAVEKLASTLLSDKPAE